MKNYIQDGNTITLTAPADVLSGAGVLVGVAFGFAVNDALSGADCETTVSGVFESTKATIDVVAQGALAYWDDTLKLLTVESAGMVKIGYFTEAAGNGDTTAIVRLVV